MKGRVNPKIKEKTEKQLEIQQENEIYIHFFKYEQLYSWLTDPVIYIIFFSTFILYLMTMYPSLSGGDSGELIVSAHLLGIAHPPGYPLWTLTSHIFDKFLSILLINSETAWRISLFSVLSSALTAVIIYQLVKIWTNEKTSGVLSAGLYISSPLLWSYSIQAEVFPLNNLLLALFLYQLHYITTLFDYTFYSAKLYKLASKNDNINPHLKHNTNRFLNHQQKHKGLLIKLSIITGLCLSHQHTSVMFLIPSLTWAILLPTYFRYSKLIKPINKNKYQKKNGDEEEGDEDKVNFFSSDLFSKFIYEIFIIGFSMLIIIFSIIIFCYFPFIIKQLQGNEVQNSWGNLKTISGFITHFFRSEYGTLQLYSGGDQDSISLFYKISTYFQNLTTQSPLAISFPLFLIGIYATTLRIFFLSKKNKIQPRYWSNLISKFGSILLISFLFYIFFFFYLCNLPIKKALFLGVFERFFMQPNLLIFIWSGVGFSYLLRIINRIIQSPIPSTVVISVVVAILFIQIQAHYYSIDQSDNYYVRDYGLAILQNLPENALLLAKGENSNKEITKKDIICNSIAYLQWTENIRQDVKVMSLEQMTYPWYIDQQSHLHPEISFPGLRYFPRSADGFSIATFIDRNYAKFPIYNAGGWKEGDPSFDTRYVMIPRGFSSLVYPKKTEITTHLIDTVIADRSADISVPKDDKKYNDITWESIVKKDYIHAQHLKSFFLLQFVLNKNLVPHSIEKSYAHLCVDNYLKLIDIVDRRNEFDYVYLNLGLCYEHLRAFYPPSDKGKEYALAMLKNWKIFLAMSTNYDDTYKQVNDAVSAWDNFLLSEKNN